MPYLTGEYGPVLEQSLTERDTQLQETEFPEIMIADALPIDFSLDLALEYVEFGVINQQNAPLADFHHRLFDIRFNQRRIRHALLQRHAGRRDKRGVRVQFFQHGNRVLPH